MPAVIRDNFIRYNNNLLHYAKAGNGDKVLLVFHGYGQNHQAFKKLAEAMPETYTCYLFDLYFHGQSRWVNNDEPLKKIEWSKTLQTFLHENRIDNFSLLGFSIGARFALATLEAFPEKTRKIFLLAPDGLKTNFWYAIATSTPLMRRLFKRLIPHPGLFFAITRMAIKLRLADRGLIRFATFHMNTEEKRRRVYYSWVVFRLLRFDPDHLARLVRTHSIPFIVIVGNRDKVILPKTISRFLKRLDYGRVVTLETDHMGIISACIPIMLEEA